MHTCHLCGNAPLIPLLDLGNHPIAQNLLREREADVYTHPVRVQLCETCGLIQLVDSVPPERFYTNYITLSSWKVHPHVPQLVTLLEKMAGLTPETHIVEVGSNDGSFLNVLRQHGFTHGVGIEPAQDARAAAQALGIPTFGEYLTPESADRFVAQYGRADLIVSRHVVEHISELQSFSDSLRKLCRPGTFVLIEIPYFDFCLDALDYSGIWEQHVNYFTRATLNHFLERTGIELFHHQTFAFSGTAQVAIGRFTGKTKPAPLTTETRADIRTRALNYRDLYPKFKTALHRELAHYRENVGPLALYGAGSRSCSFVNFLDVGRFFDFVADDQPEKQNLFLPGSRLPVLPGTALDESNVTRCLLGVNAEVEDKVIARRTRFTARGGEFRSIHPPSPRLLEVWSEVRREQLTSATS
jgi:hypothetical protein